MAECSHGKTEHEYCDRCLEISTRLANEPGGITKRSKVTKRLTQEKSHRLLLGKEDSLADYIRSNERAFDARGL
jgi:hypothetical protein